MWSCSQCGESVEESFERCWNCYTTRDGEPTPPAPPPQPAGASTAPENTLWKLLLRFIHWFHHPSCAMIGVGLYFAFAVITVFVVKFRQEEQWDEKNSPMVLCLYGISLFIPRAIQQRNRTHLLWMTFLGSIAPFVALGATLPWNPHDALVFDPLLFRAGLAVLVGAGEWVASRENSWRSLFWLTGVPFAAICLHKSVVFVLWRIDWITFDPSDLLFTTAIWLAIPLAFRCTATSSVRLIRATAIASLGFVAFYFAFFSWGIYEVAKISLHSGYLLDRNYSVRLLNYRGRDSDYEAIVRGLDAADWTIRLDHSSLYGDWRKMAVRVLVEHDEQEAAGALSTILLNHPNPLLIGLTEDLIARHKRYETVPVLMRYALMESAQPTIFAVVGDDQCKELLEELEVPQVVKAWINDVAYLQFMFEAIRAREESRESSITSDDLVANDALRSKLGHFLRLDAGPRLNDWDEAYNENISRAPTPLSEPLRAETDRVVACFERYQDLLSKWVQAKNRANRDLERPDEPDWNVPTTEALEQEIEGYSTRVSQIVPNDT